VYSPTTAPPEALSSTIIVHSLDAPVPGTVGLKVMDRLSDLPRLSKYSTESSCGAPGAPACVSVAGRFSARSTSVVALPTNWFELIWTGSSPPVVSRG
jgi:hypothetical protein